MWLFIKKNKILIIITLLLIIATAGFVLFAFLGYFIFIKKKKPIIEETVVVSTDELIIEKYSKKYEIILNNSLKYSNINKKTPKQEYDFDETNFILKTINDLTKSSNVDLDLTKKQIDIVVKILCIIRNIANINLYKKYEKMNTLIMEILYKRISIEKYCNNKDIINWKHYKYVKDMFEKFLNN